MNNTELTKTDNQTLALNFGSVNLSDLTEEQKNEVRMIVAKKQVELAAEFATRKIKLDSAVADMRATLDVVDRLSQTSSSFKVNSTHTTSSGSTTITAGKIKLFS